MEGSIITGNRESSLEDWSKKCKVNQDFVNSLAMVIDEPEESPYLLESLTDSFSSLKKASKNEVRNALLRVQIHCSINTNSDPIKVSKQLFVSQILEKLFFGNNLLMSEEMMEEEKPAKKGAAGRKG